MQTRRQSLLEAWTNVAIGWLVGLLTQIVVFPLYGMKVKLIDNMQITIIFTIVSLIRSYLLRRFYNELHRPSRLNNNRP
jgi:membrane protein implicated in regulation of membrane protease activity